MISIRLAQPCELEMVGEFRYRHLIEKKHWLYQGDVKGSLMDHYDLVSDVAVAVDQTGHLVGTGRSTDWSHFFGGVPPALIETGIEISHDLQRVDCTYSSRFVCDFHRRLRVEQIVGLPECCRNTDRLMTIGEAILQLLFHRQVNRGVEIDWIEVYPEAKSYYERIGYRQLGERDYPDTEFLRIEPDRRIVIMYLLGFDLDHRDAVSRSPVCDCVEHDPERILRARRLSQELASRGGACEAARPSCHDGTAKQSDKNFVKQ